MYKIIRNNQGKVSCITFQNENGSVTSFGIGDNRYYLEFLDWNSKQVVPLDLSDYPPDLPTREEIQKQNNITLLKNLKTKDNWTSQDLENAVKALINLNF